MGLVNLADLSELKIADGILLRAVNTPAATVAHVQLTAGAKLPEHSHINEQVVNVVEGELELTVEKIPYSLTSGKVMVLKPNVPHSGRAVTNCRVIDVFTPPREDFAGKDFDGYPKKK